MSSNLLASCDEDDHLPEEVRTLLLSPRRFNSPLSQQTYSTTSSVSSGYVDSTIVASVVGHHKAKSGSHTVYEILVNVRYGDETVSAWKVRRRYNAFHKLHQDLKDLGFPCPELPPKQLLWATFNQSSFLQQRMAALNVWLQGTLCIWQSIRIENVKSAYEIAELLETFLCEDDSVEEARARGVSSPFVNFGGRLGKHPLNSANVGKSGGGIVGGGGEVDKLGGSSGDGGSDGGGKSSKESKTNITPHSILISNSTKKKLLMKNKHDEMMMDSNAEKKEVKQLFPPGVVPVGVAAISYKNPNGGVSPGEEAQQFTMFTGDGKSVQQTFRPFTATVHYDVDRNATASCTPVSVPPTPHGQHEFLNSWSRYTETVLEYVADRLEMPNYYSRNSRSAATYTAEDDVRRKDNVDDDGDDDEEEEYVSFQTKEGGSTFLFSSAAIARHVSSSSSNGSNSASTTSSCGQQQVAGDTTGPNRKRERVDRHGGKLIRKLLHETDHAIDFVGSTWQFVAELKNVVILRKQERGKRNLLHCFMGRGKLQCKAHDVFDLVRDPSNRHLYDRMAREGADRLVETLDGAYDPIVFQHTFETKQRLCFLRYSRDFCVLQYSKLLSDGRFVVVATSVKHTNCPPQEGTVRAKIGLYGWVIEPVDENSCKATYLVQVDFGGNVPNKFLESMSFRQPLCIRYVEHYLNECRPKEPKQQQSEIKQTNSSSSSSSGTKHRGSRRRSNNNSSSSFPSSAHSGDEEESSDTLSLSAASSDNEGF